MRTLINAMHDEQPEEKAAPGMQDVAEVSRHTLDAQDTEGDLHKRMVSSKAIEVRAAVSRRASYRLLMFEMNECSTAILLCSLPRPHVPRDFFIAEFKSRRILKKSDSSVSFGGYAQKHIFPHRVLSLKDCVCKQSYF